MPLEADEATAEKIRKDYEGGKGYPELAHKYHMTIADLARIIKGGDVPASGGADISVGPEGSFIKVTMWVPVMMFNLYDLAVQAGMSKHKDVGAFMFHYAQIGFKREHGHQLSLVAVGEEKGDGSKEVQELRKMYKDLDGKFNSLLESLKEPEEEHPPAEVTPEKVVKNVKGAKKGAKA